MANYRDIKGFQIQSTSSDPVPYSGTWASGGNFPGNRNSAAGFGVSQTAALVGGGFTGTAYVNTTFEYDGSSWTSGGSLNASVGQARTGHGTLTAGGIAAGYKESGNAVINNYETYDGSSFTEEADLNTARQAATATGSVTAALVAGGTTGVGPGGTQEGITNVESWNGTSWTETHELNTATKEAASFTGSPAPTMAVAGGGTDSSIYDKTESYNGSAWTEVNNLNTARSILAGSGTAFTSALVYGGNTGSRTAKTEGWDGTNWTELNDMGTARGRLVGAGSNSASALASTGRSPSSNESALVEEFSFPSITASILQEGDMWYNTTSNTLKAYGKAAGIPAGTWAAGTSLNTARGRAGFAGYAYSTTHVGLVFGGGTPPKTVNTEQYDGTSWTEKNNLNTARYGFGGAGTLTSAIYIGGEVATSPYPSQAVEQWDGSSWTETTELNTGIRNNVGIGATNTDTITASGYTTTAVATTEKWNGTTWTELADQNAAKYARGGAGTTTAGILFGGQDPTTNTETWDGSSWTEVAELNTAGEYRAASGSSSSLVLAVGKYPAGTNVEAWNGTAWSEINDISTGRWEGSGTGSASFGLIAGGNTGSVTNATEEFIAPAVVSTVTTS